MEYADGEMGQCIMEKAKRVRRMVMGITGIQMGMKST
jgi:hypothetical protein